MINWPELEARDRKNNQLLEELQAFKARVTEVDRLRQENESLKAEISKLRKYQKDQPTSSESRIVLSELSPNKRTNTHRVTSPKTPSGDGDSDLAKKYKTLKAEYKDVLRTNQGYKTKLRQRKETIESWAKHSDLQEEKIKELLNKLKTRRPTEVLGKGDTKTIDDVGLDGVPPRGSSPGSSLKQEPPLSPPTVVIPGPCNAPLPSKHISSEAQLHHLPCVITDIADELPSIPSLSADDVSLPPHLYPPKESGAITVKSEPSSDGPVFISARPVRKRKYGNDEPESSRIRKIKAEHSSSPGVERVGEPHSSAAESIDFEDEVHVPTPRKRKFTLNDIRVNQDTDIEGTPRPKFSEILRSSAPGVSTPDRPFSASRRTMGPDDTHQTSGMRENFVQLHGYNQTKKRHSTSFLSVGVMDLAEDGDAGLESASNPVLRGRLYTMLNSPLRDSLVSTNKTTLPSGQLSRSATPKLTPQRELPWKKNKTVDETTPISIIRAKNSTVQSPQPSVVRNRGPKKPSILRDDLPRGRSATRESIPLRDRPIERLRPEDFKPNPQYNDGLTYVYDEVVRGKEARAALSGCIDPNCCGKTFRHFAEAERRMVGSSVTTRAEDIKLLENYLGDEAWKLGPMLREDKEQIWLEAKTWELANKFGKHRQRYSRMPTPPGFWAVDFPSTQERAEEMRQAEEIRKALVHDRYREAMRTGGSWLFRDEEPR